MPIKLDRLSVVISQNKHLWITYLGFALFGKILLNVEGARSKSKRSVDFVDTPPPPRIKALNPALHLTQQETGLYEIRREIAHLRVYCIPHDVVSESAGKEKFSKFKMKYCKNLFVVVVWT